jgi:ParB family chromosome partitioning protein
MPALIDLLRPDEHGAVTEVRRLAIDRISSNPGQPRRHFDAEALADLAASIREHGILQPVLVRPRADGHFQLVAGERRWRAARLAGLTEVPAIVEQIDDESALEITIIENLQREDISPLEEAEMFDRMTTQHGYSLRKLAQKLGKDKGYIENRLRLAGAPTEIKQLVSLRKDTLSHAYELLKVDDPKKRRRLAEQVANGELSLVKLREKIDGKPASAPSEPRESASADVSSEADDNATEFRSHRQGPASDNALIAAKQGLAEAIDQLADVLGSSETLREIGDTDRTNLAKYLTIAKIRLENAITVVRSGRPLDH